jgi:hypothetical protein
MERFNLKKLNAEEIKEKYQVTIKTSLQLWNTGGIGRIWDTIRENITILVKESISHYESRYNKSLG